MDDGVEAAEPVNLFGNGLRPGDSRKITGDGSLGLGCRREGIATSAVVPPMQDDLMALLDQEPGRKETEAVR